jgi:hypothetical protein
MPRYFFHINDGHEFPDNDGTVLDGVAAAHAQAIATAGAMITENGVEIEKGTEWHMIVADETGHIVCDLHFSAHCPE